MRVTNATLTIQMFGDLHLSVNAEPVPPPPTKVQQLLALLVLLGQEHPLSRAWLAETLWPGSPAQRQMLRSAVFTLRENLGSARERLPAENRKTLRLDLAGASVDVLEFDRAITLGEDERAVRLYRGELLKGWPEEWASRERERRAQDYERALERLQTDTKSGSLSIVPAAAQTSGSPRIMVPPVLSLPGADTREISRLRALVTESRTHLARAVDALEQLERRVVLLEAAIEASVTDRKAGEDVRPDARRVGAQDTETGKSLYDLGVVAFLQGRDDEAEDLLTQALAIFTAPPPDRGREADIYHKLSGLAIRKEDYALAREYARRCRDIRAEMNDDNGLVGALLHLGDVAPSVEEAVGYYKQASQVAARGNNPEGLAWAEASIAQAPLFQGTWTPDLLPDTARRYLLALDNFMKHRVSTGVFNCLDGTVRLLWATGRREEAMRLLARCNRLRATLDIARTGRQERWFRHLLEEGNHLIGGAAAAADQNSEEQCDELTLEQAARYASDRLRQMSRTAPKQQQQRSKQ